MKKNLIIFLAFLLTITACNRVPTEQPLQISETLTYTSTAEFTPTTRATDTVTPTPSVEYKLAGLDFGPFTEDGQNPDLGSTIPIEQLEKQVEFLAPYTEWIRSYGCVGFEQIVPIAHQLGLKVALSAWLGKDEAANDKEISCLVKTAVLYPPEMVIVGSETLSRGDLSAAKLAEYLQTVKTVLPDSVVATADTSQSWLAHPEIIEASDVILTNIYPYWEGVDIDQAISRLNSTYSSLKAISGGKEVWISETGWPDQGNIINKAVPSAENAAFYFLNFVSWARAKDVSYFYFDAFDEPWKETDKNPQEAHWGVWTSDYVMKEGMDQVFMGNTVPDNWTPTETPVPTKAPTIAVTKQPIEITPQQSPSISIVLPAGKNWPEGSVVKGYAKNMDPSKYRVAVYIKVDGGWWSKPYFDSPLTKISANGYWESAFITGGNDANANEIVAYLVPSNVNVSLASGGGLPDMGSYPMARISR